MQKKSEVLGKLPIHPGDREHAQPHVLRVDGLVGRCLELTAADLKGLPQRELIDDFTCLEGWTVPKLNWRGVPLIAILALAEMRAEARWVQASAGEFSIPIPIQDAAKVLLATHLGPEALPNEHGGPMRLVVPGADCFTSIKWLDHLELRAEAGANTGRTIALGRLSSP